MSAFSHIEPLSVRNMRYFVTLVEMGSIKAAAEVLHLSPVVLRSRMQTLAKALGEDLLERIPSGVTPTAAGRQLYEVCKLSLEALGDVERNIRGLRDDDVVAGRSRFAIHPGLSRTILRSVLPPLLDKHRHLDVIALEAEGDIMLSWLEEENLDFAVGIPDVQHWWISEIDDFHDQPVLCSREPLTAVGAGGVTVADMQKLKLVWHNLFGNISPEFSELTRILAAVGGPQLKMNGFLAAIALVRQSDWCSIVPLPAIVEEVEAGELFAYPVIPVAAERLIVARHTDRPLSPAALILAAAIGDALKELGQRSAAHMKRP